MIFQSLPTSHSFRALPGPTTRRPNLARPIATVAFIFCFFFTLSFLRTSTPAATSALSTDGFKAGNIMNDYTMGNYTTMSEADIQAWLTQKNPCNNTNYATYQQLSNKYKDRDPSVYSWHWQPDDPKNPEKGHFVCLSEETFGEGKEISPATGGETAAHIIYQAAQDYKINPQVFLVLLQKEMSLITDDIPRSGQYNSATGYGCTDSAPCFSQYAGFKNQIRGAAYLFRASLDGKSSMYPIGKNYVQYNKDKSCGGSEIIIENYATSALYRYTPYQPNAAALAAGSGYGNTCSAYGNRNFYIYFTQWFGSTQTGANVKSNIYLPEGEYTLQSASATTYALDVYGAYDKDGTNVQLFQTHSGAAQKVNLVYNPSSKLYNIINLASGKAIATFSSEPTANVQLSNLNKNSCTQQWAVQLAKDGTYKILNACSGAALDFHGAKAGNEVNLTTWPSSSDKTQNWQIANQATAATPISAGIYNVHSTNGLSLDVYGAYKDSGTNVQLWAAHNESNRQKYQFQLLPDGTYHIIDLNSNRYIDVNGALGDNGTNVQIWEKSGSCAQKWFIEKDPKTKNAYHILSTCAPNKALDINGAVLKNSTNVQIWDKNTSAAQDWLIQPTSAILADGDYRIAYAADTTKSLNVVSASKTSGAKIHLGSSTDLFHVARGSDGYYTIKNLNSGHYLDAFGAVAENGTQIQQWVANTTCAQKWEIQQNSDKSYRVISACSGFYSLDLYEGLTKVGTKIELWQNNNTAAQKWQFNQK